MELKRNPKLLVQEKTALLIIDIQEKIISVINNAELVVENTLKLIKGFNELAVPIYVTEQYPKGLGKTLPEIIELIHNFEPIEKMTFSCCGADNLFQDLKSANIEQVVVCGIESHVCVQQTALDLAANGFQVIIAADACSSRREFDYDISLNRMRDNNIEITTTESILFELLNICGTPQFKAISKIVK